MRQSLFKNKRAETQDIFYLDISKLIVSVALFIIFAWLIMQLIMIFWPAPDPNMISVKTAANQLKYGLDDFDSISKNNIAIIPIIVRINNPDLKAFFMSKTNKEGQSILSGEICLRKDTLNVIDCANFDPGDVKIATPAVSYFDAKDDALNHIRYTHTQYIVLVKNVNKNTDYSLYFLRTPEELARWKNMQRVSK